MPYRPAIYRQAELPIDEPTGRGKDAHYCQRDDRDLSGLEFVLGFIDEFEQRQKAKPQEVNGEH